MKLLNFSIGKVQTVQIRGASVRTAHVKSPVERPWVITEGGPLGDERAVHPDKVYAYARSHYGYWGAYLGVDPATWSDGFFGENLTFDAFDEQDFRVGDVYALGDEVRLVVAGPRNPCAKLAWRLQQPPTFQKIFRLSGHTGVYFGVINPGVVRPGDVARRVQHDPLMPSIVETAGYVSGHSTPPVEPLQRLLASPHLSRTIRMFLTAKLDAAERAAATSAGRWKGWRDFRIDRIASETAQTRSVYLRPVDGGNLCRPRPGQFVSVQMQGAADETITRSWSLSSFAHDMDQYRLTVRRQEGAGSNWLHRANVGATVRLRAPTGEFTLDTGSVRPVVLVAAGIGITPLFAMLQAHVARGPTAAPAHLIYGVRTPADAVFSAELQAIVAAHPGVKVTYLYSQSDEGGRPAGRITSDLVIELLRGLFVILGDRRIDLPWYENDMYLCGPGDFCERIKRELIERGANPDHIFLEQFIGVSAATTDVETAQVRFQRSGIDCSWRADEDLTLLELAEQAGVAVENDCRAGSCLSCRTRVLDGALTADLGDGTALLCIGRPKTPNVTLDC